MVSMFCCNSDAFTSGLNKYECDDRPCFYHWIWPSTLTPPPPTHTHTYMGMLDLWLAPKHTATSRRPHTSKHISQLTLFLSTLNLSVWFTHNGLHTNAKSIINNAVCTLCRPSSDVFCVSCLVILSPSCPQSVSKGDIIKAVYNTTCFIQPFPSVFLWDLYFVHGVLSLQ